MDNSSAVDPALLAKIEQKQKERQEQFTKLRQTYILNEKANSIVLLPGAELRRKLQSREVSALEALEAFTAKALEVTEKFNCVTEFIPQALEWASALDKEANTSHRPLRGLPVAIKDDQDVEGMDTTLGFAKNLYKPARESSVLVKILLKLGAVPFVKTNVPQSILSSGGGAAFATGSDLGGSLRIPSHYHGISTIRPTVNRLSEKGLVQALPELVLQPGVPGIMAPDARTLAVVWKAITENSLQNSFDPMAVPIPWNESLFASGEKLKIGYYTSLPFCPAFDETQKTVMAAKRALESKGHTVVEFEMVDDFHYLKIICDLLLADHGRHLKTVFSGEPVSYCMAGLVDVIRKSKSTKASEEGKTKREQILHGEWGADVKTAVDLWDIGNQKKVIAQEILRRMEKAGVDLLLSPVFPYPAVKLQNGHNLHGLGYTMIWNFVNFPAGVVRFGKETGAGFDTYDDQHDPILKQAKEAVPESVGMPINVQIIGTPFKEELVLRALVELERLQKNN